MAAPFIANLAGCSNPVILYTFWIGNAKLDRLPSAVRAGPRHQCLNAAFRPAAEVELNRSEPSAWSSCLSAIRLHAIIMRGLIRDGLTLRAVHGSGFSSWTSTAIAVSIIDILVIAVASYALGCISFAYYAVRISTGEDIRELESGTAGARNVARVLGRPAALAVMAGDIGKGALAVWVAKAVATDVQGALLAMTLVVAGHIWPLQLGFRGGKGLATGLGALLVAMPAVALGATALNAILSLVLRSPTAGTLLATAITPILAISLAQGAKAAALLALPVGIILLSHRENISRLISGRKTRP